MIVRFISEGRQEEYRWILAESFLLSRTTCNEQAKKTHLQPANRQSRKWLPAFTIQESSMEMLQCCKPERHNWYNKTGLVSKKVQNNMLFFLWPLLVLSQRRHQLPAPLNQAVFFNVRYQEPGRLNSLIYVKGLRLHLEEVVEGRKVSYNCTPFWIEVDPLNKQLARLKNLLSDWPFSFYSHLFPSHLFDLSLYSC